MSQNKVETAEDIRHYEVEQDDAHRSTQYGRHCKPCLVGSRSS
nr:hypothetical protein [Pseudomonas sp. RW407]